ncbi:Hemolysin activation/secretion protein [Novosphingobium mathurense]|uniref:Hemolysin activation/secretion protein n=1 Tax=Novosphingobium mathurense TaxID=428990 RepID=A0A1U6HWE9_9SPHN|nr:Hemolysin activation/secretion protein [Novosphingobium mathurense]
MATATGQDPRLVRGGGFLWIAELVVAFGLAIPSVAQAQSVPLTPPARSDLEPLPQEQAAPRPRLTVDERIERAPCALEDPAYSSIKIRIATATFRNLGPVDASELADTYGDFVGTEQPISVVCRIRDAAATKLRKLGYIAAVQVPAQRIEDGAVNFEVLYAKVTSIRVVGKVGRNERLIENYLSKLADGQLFNRFQAERYLLLARDIPGYQVRLSLKPAGTGAGEMIGEVRIDYTPVTVDFSAQNYAGPGTGRYGGQLRAVFNGLTGMGDRTTLSFYSTAQVHEQNILQAGHEMALGGNGLRIGGRVTYAWTRPDLGPAVPDVSARTLFANVEAIYPFLRKQAVTIRAAAGLDFVNQKVDFGGIPLSEDRLRVGYVRLDLDAIDLKGMGPGGSILWKFNGSLEARKGLSIFGASPDCMTQQATCLATGFVPPSLIGGDPNASVFRFNANLELHPLRRFAVTFSPRAQVSTAGLFSFDRFSMGNYTVGRGFDPGTVTGDDGIGIQTELRHEGFRLNPRSNVEFQPYLFLDNGWTWDRSSPTGGAQPLHSLGGGLRSRVGGRARLDLAVAFPLTTLPGETGRRDPRFLVTYSMNLLPWSTR